jgi:hypothetical protein
MMNHSYDHYCEICGRLIDPMQDIHLSSEGQDCHAECCPEPECVANRVPSRGDERQ